MIALGLAVVAVVVAAGCAGDAEETGGDAALFDVEPAVRIDLELSDVAFDVDELTVPAGEVVAIGLRNVGAEVHDFTVDAPDTRAAFRVTVGDPLPHDPPRRASAHVAVRNGGAAELRLEVGAPGQYEFYCAVPGHRAAGMHGTLTITPETPN